MPQTAIIQPATPKGPPQTRTAGTPGKKEQNGFSPHLDKAVSNTRQQQQANRDESRTTTSSKTDKKTSSQYSSPSPKSQKPGDSRDNAVAANTVNKPADSDATPEQLSVPVFDSEQSKKEFPTTAFSQLQQIEPPAQQLHSQLQQIEPPAQHLQNTTNASLEETVLQNNILTELSPAITETIAENAIKPTPLSTVPSSKIAETIAENAIKPATMSTVPSPANTEPIIENSIKQTTAKEQNVLIDQLQRIIDQADETGTVSITKAAGTTPLDSIRSNFHGVLLPETPANSAQILVQAAAEPSGAAVSSLLIMETDGAETAVARPTEQLTGIRQDNQQQYFNPKIATKNLGDASQNSQEHRRGDELPQQSMGTGSQTGQLSALTSGPEQNNTFSQMVATSLPATTQPTTAPTGATASTTFLPSGIPVQESEIMQQLSQKLQLSGRNMDSRINLKLHPAELGSLKIDLTVKEGSIRANVVAQSQHTSEILEKNMTKLKTILENQGFTVDEISVTAESDSVNDFNLFDRQLFSQNDYTPKGPKGRREDEPVFTLADNVFAAPAMSTGVNVKI